MCSVHPPAPAKTAFVFFKQAVGIHRGMQSRTGFLLSPMDFIACVSPMPLGLQARAPASITMARGEKWKAGKAATQAGFSLHPPYSKHP